MEIKLGILFTLLSLHKVISQSINSRLGFRATPRVSAECSTTTMFVWVDTAEPFTGIVNGHGFRDSCFTKGDGTTKRTVLVIPLLSSPSDAVYCGAVRDLATGDYKVAVDVHAHQVLEVDGDKTFIINCNQNGILGSGVVHLSLLRNGEDLSRAVQGEDYTVRINYTNDTLDNQQLDVKNCVAFGRGNFSQPLSDARGCPVEGSGLSKFTRNGGYR
ncbi:hypothetical protein BV898_13661 [Hypsibius exemplaris]|uniref:ZP domain-containing protein n=1 Tax=Hypsibius exemplaris TaxID=2072580 RepID=A0A1W0WAB0_HYPEX|nr:hypothetical protein BV898_13661 [Hypsibius exemplaris]